MNREYIKNKVWWSIYMLEIDTHGKKSKHWKHTNFMYPGITTDLARRIKEHVYCLTNSWLTKNFYNATKRLVYVEYFHGTEFEAIQREREIKDMSPTKKVELVYDPNKNMLVVYSLIHKAIVLKKNGSPEEQIKLEMI